MNRRSFLAAAVLAPVVPREGPPDYMRGFVLHRAGCPDYPWLPGSRGDVWAICDGRGASHQQCFAPTYWLLPKHGTCWSATRSTGGEG